MGFFQNPITPPDPYEPYRIEGLGESHSPKQPDGGDEPPKWTLAAYLLGLLKKGIDFFLDQEKKGSQEPKRETVENLLSFKACLETLKRENRSEDIHFLNHLSKLWEHLLEDTLKEQSPLFKKIIRSIQHYPPHETHTLGYYLSEYAGQKWIPFPYMELIQKLHSEHEKNPTDSALSEWSLLIDELLSNRK